MNYKELIYREIKAIKKIPTDQIEKLVDILTIPGRSGKIVSSGMGKAGQIAHTLSTTLSSTGTPSFFIHPAEAQHGDLGMLDEKDTVIVISNSGKTKEVIEFIHLCRALFPAIEIYSLVGEKDSEVQVLCDYSIVYGPVEEICPLRLTPTTSTTCMSVICDLIVVGIMNRIEFSKEDYSKRHHGGYLYKKSTENI